MRVEKCRHLPHVGHAADVPVADVLVKVRRFPEHCTVRRHAANRMRKERREERRGEGRKEGRRKEGRTLRQVTIHGCAVR